MALEEKANLGNLCMYYGRGGVACTRAIYWRYRSILNQLVVDNSALIRFSSISLTMRTTYDNYWLYSSIQMFHFLLKCQIGDKIHLVGNIIAGKLEY